MKHIFIVNPAAGKSAALPSLLSKITYAAKELDIDYEIYHTVTVGDATKYVAEKCREYPNERFRFYSCGGDGTMNEVVNSLVGNPMAELAIVPAGTGNDFIRIFSHKENFNDIKKIINGSSIKIDAVRYNDRYSLNILNIGFDCDVVSAVEEIKRNPLIPKSMSYSAAVMQTLTRKYGKMFKVITEDGKVIGGEHLLALFANAQYYGGGYKAAPFALVNDGLLDVIVIDKVSRATFVKFLSKYKSGTYMDVPEKVPFVHYFKCKKVIFESEETSGVCADGEISPAKKLEIEIVPNSVNVVVPEGSKCRALFKKVKNEEFSINV